MPSSVPFFSVAKPPLSVSPPIRINCRFVTSSPSTTANDPNSMAAPGPKWVQKTVTLPPLWRGCHLITPKIAKEIDSELSGFNCGLAHLFLQHTSASLTINENYDSDVRADTETFLNRIVPEGASAPWRHTLEGFQSPMGSLTWERGREYGCVSIVTILLLERLWSPLLEYKMLQFGNWFLPYSSVRMKLYLSICSDNQFTTYYCLHLVELNIWGKRMSEYFVDGRIGSNKEY